jgi:hypothetical protein
MTNLTQNKIYNSIITDSTNILSWFDTLIQIAVFSHFELYLRQRLCVEKRRWKNNYLDFDSAKYQKNLIQKELKAIIMLSSPLNTNKKFAL